jgi:hypothetical protein
MIEDFASSHTRLSPEIRVWQPDCTQSPDLSHLYRRLYAKTGGRGPMKTSIRPDDVRLRIGHMNARRNLIRMRPVGSLRVYPDPMPRRSRKLDHLSRRVTPHQVILKLNRIRLMWKRSNLHAPPSAWKPSLARSRSPRLHSHLRHTHAIQPNLLRRRQRQIKDPPMHKRSAIRNLHHRRLVRRQVRHPYY